MRWAVRFVDGVLSELATPDTVLLDPYTEPEVPMNCEDISFNRVFEDEAHHDGPEQQYELCHATSNFSTQQRVVRCKCVNEKRPGRRASAHLSPAVTPSVTWPMSLR